MFNVWWKNSLERGKKKKQDIGWMLNGLDFQLWICKWWINGFLLPKCLMLGGQILLKGERKRKQDIGWVLNELDFQLWETNVTSKSLENKANKQNNINKQPSGLIDR